MKKILVPTDFSPNAGKALDFAVQMARKANASIILVHVCDLIDLSVKNNLWLKKEYNKKLVEEAREKLNACREIVKNEEHISIETILYDGLITETLLDAAKKLAPDLIVMGTLGDSGFKEKIFGSKTAGLIGKSDVPILAVPLLSVWCEPANILLALSNFDEGRPEVISPALELARLFNSHLIVTGFSETSDEPEEEYAVTEQAGKNYIQELQSHSGSIFSPAYVHLYGTQFEKTIEEYVSENNIDILAMITHKRGFFKSLFKKSMTKKMSYHSDIPLLAIPAKPVAEDN